MRICGQQHRCEVLLVATGLLAVSVASAASAIYHESYLDDPAITLADAYDYVELLREEIRKQERGDEASVTEEELLVGYEGLLILPCATGRFNAHEEWIAYMQRDTRDLIYRKRGTSVAQQNAPCALILTEAHALRDQRDAKRRETARRPTVEIFDDRVGNYVAVDWPQRDTAVLVKDGNSFSVASAEVEHDPVESVEPEASPDESSRHLLFEVNAFAFTSTVDILDGVQRRAEFALASEEFVSTVDVFERDDLEADDLTVAAAYYRLEQLLVDERKLLTPVSSELTELTWQSTFGLEEWKELRATTPLEQRKELSLQWTLLAKILLVASNNATSSMNCLRRAACWNPSEVPAYIQMSSLLEYYGYQNASCQIMEKILENVDPTEFRSGEMRSVLTKNFPHCSVIIRMANLWENSLVVRCVLAVSAVISLLHGIFIAGSSVYDRFGGQTAQNLGSGRVEEATAAVRPQQQAVQSNAKTKHE